MRVSLNDRNGKVLYQNPAYLFREQYEVSRPVVRQALSELQYEGVLERIKGRGTFVAPQLTSQSLVQSLTGLHEDVVTEDVGRVLREFDEAGLLVWRIDE